MNHSLDESSAKLTAVHTDTLTITQSLQDELGKISASLTALDTQLAADPKSADLDTATQAIKDGAKKIDELTRKLTDSSSVLSSFTPPKSTTPTSPATPVPDQPFTNPSDHTTPTPSEEIAGDPSAIITPDNDGSTTVETEAEVKTEGAESEPYRD